MYSQAEFPLRELAVEVVSGIRPIDWQDKNVNEFGEGQPSKISAVLGVNCN